MFIGGDGGGKAESDRKRERQNSGKDYLLAQAKNFLVQVKTLQAGSEYDHPPSLSILLS